MVLPGAAPIIWWPAQVSRGGSYPIIDDGATEMGIEGQFAGLTAPTRRQPALAKDGRSKSYLSDIRRFAMLERNQEYELAKRWREDRDRDAANQLVTSHLRLAAKIAMGYRGYGLPISEIISEGNVGLMQALSRFEPEKGFRFATYAMWWIRASIQDYILRSWSLVKIGTTANQKKLFFKLRSAKSKIAALESGDLHPDQVALIAKDLDVTDQDVVDMNRRLGGDKSINAPLHENGETGEWQDHLVDQSPSPETIVVEQDEKLHRHTALIAAIEVLEGRERRIFEARLLADNPATLEDLAAQFNVSRERIRQIEVRAFEKVRKAARNLAAQAPAAMMQEA
jgi:RNA polymerase sigma-32 factor